jgi:hypothetical protein
MNGSVHSITRPDEQTLTLLADRFLDLWMNGISRKSLTLANFKIHSASIHPEQAQ